MKKTIFILLLSILLTGCSSNESTNNISDSDEENTEKHTEILESGVMYYMTLIISKYSSVDTLATTKEEEQKILNEALTDVNIAVNEMQHEYDSEIPAIKELNQLADAVIYAINDLLEGNYNTKLENSEKVGNYIGEISRNYLDGELPSVIKSMTGLENAN
ncbi:hypothetical protein MHI57_15910 [Cytobacillus sp. FSL K6-0129]|uniref:hypothetical protein n=1 Tax=Cytobacillus sp. FSL K6-0129 TaxID=2921421 RepID=UPI0030FAE1FD